MQSIPLTVAASSRTPCPCKHVPFIINKHIRIRLQQHYYTIRYYEHHINTSIMRNRNEWLMMTRTYTPHISGFYRKYLSPNLRKIWQGLCPYFWYFLKNAWSPFVSLIWPGLRRHMFCKKLKSHPSDHLIGLCPMMPLPLIVIRRTWPQIPVPCVFPYDAAAVGRN